MRPVECQGRQLKTAKQHHYAQQTDVFIQRPSVGKEVEGTDVPCALRGDRLQQGLEDAGRKAEQSSLYTRKASEADCICVASHASLAGHATIVKHW